MCSSHVGHTPAMSPASGDEGYSRIPLDTSKRLQDEAMPGFNREAFREELLSSVREHLREAVLDRLTALERQVAPKFEEENILGRISCLEQQLEATEQKVAGLSALASVAEEVPLEKALLQQLDQLGIIARFDAADRRFEEGLKMSYELQGALRLLAARLDGVGSEAMGDMGKQKEKEKELLLRFSTQETTEVSRLEVGDKFGSPGLSPRRSVRVQVQEEAPIDEEAPSLPSLPKLLSASMSALSQDPNSQTGIVLGRPKDYMSPMKMRSSTWRSSTSRDMSGTATVLSSNIFSPRIPQSGGPEAALEQLQIEMMQVQSQLKRCQRDGRLNKLEESMSRSSSKFMSKAITERSVSESSIDLAAELSNSYKLKESLWDASLFLGHRSLGTSSNILLFFALVVNAVLQFGLCFIVAFWFSFDPYTEEVAARLREWVSGMTPEQVMRVCTNDVALSSNFMQQVVHMETSTYIQMGLLVPYERGPMLCTIVIFMWSLHVVAVIHDALNFMLAIKRKGTLSEQLPPEGPHSSSMRLGHGSDQFHIERLDRRRFYGAMFCGVLQIFIASALLVAGSLWLVYTRDMSDLMLNAVALSYIMELDEMLYSVLVPRKVKVLVDLMEPLPLTDGSSMGTECGRCCKGWHWRTIFTFFLTFGFGFVMLVFFITPNTRVMREISEIICGPE